jgi:proteasome lid subunit RPN8/RPN11
MIRIDPGAWQVMIDHGRQAFPKECCGILLGREDGAGRHVTIAIACRNAYEGDRPDRFAIDPRDILAAEKRSRSLGLSILGFFHSHPNENAYFSKTDLDNCGYPGYSNVVMSIRDGEFSHARSFIVNPEQTAAEAEDLHYSVTD